MCAETDGGMHSDSRGSFQAGWRGLFVAFVPASCPPCLWMTLRRVDNSQPFDHNAPTAMRRASRLRHSGVIRFIDRGQYERKGIIMNTNMNEPHTLRGNISNMVGKAREWYGRAARRLCVWDARLRTIAAEPEAGAATAEYAVVLVAATGFAALLVGILKSGTIKTLLTDIVKQALNV